MWGKYRLWEYYADFFCNRGFRFIAPTLRYHFPGNQRVKELGRTSVNDYVADIAQLIRYLSECGLPAMQIDPLPPPIVFGHSMGGLIAQKIASYGIASLTVLLNSAPPAGVSLHADLRYQLTMLRYLPYFILGKPFKPSFHAVSYYVMNNIPESERLEHYRHMVYESGRAAWEIRTEKISVDFSKITCPLLIIGAEKDRIVPCRVAKDIYKQTAYTGATFQIYEKFAHRIQVEPDWEEAAEDIYSWIKEKVRL